MKLTICIDDTDIIGSKGTGEIAEELGEKLVQLGLGQATGVSRHQLYVHQDIPYTSHNSSMCFELTEVGASIDEVIGHCIAHLIEHSAVGSDPGLAVATEQADWPALIEFGQQAKRQVLNKTLAYQLAEQAGVHLSEHGGSGDGIIGALAGLGLRRDGNDGRMKGQVKLNLSAACVAELLKQPEIDSVIDLNHKPLPQDAVVQLSGKVKTVRVNQQCALLVYQQADGRWHNAGKSQLKAY
ncbi:hypothetical protein [Ferrimonas senticii]|uniref:hypothetical protein n=1 Tax=Ferrimonas senticii TaxID=394566 RepID=UPI000400C5AD|nr:hypothetical protein [Ferrimonas senticii]